MFDFDLSLSFKPFVGHEENSMNEISVRNQEINQIKVAIVGLGYRGKQLWQLLRTLPFFRVVAVADPALSGVEYPEVVCYHHDGEAYRTMLKEQRPDLVFIASPWQCHVLHALACVEAGCDVALEIKGGLYLEEYAPLLQLAHERHRRVYPLENTLFMREILSVLTLVQAGLLGEVVYMRGGYRHDLRNLLLDDAGHLGNREKTESIWRSRFYQEDNGDLYPTHGLAPLCMIAGVNRTDRVKRLTSFASMAAGLPQRIRELGGDTSLQIRQGDVVVTQLETEKGILISLTHDTTLPRPRSLDYEIQGTKGIWQGDRRCIYLEGISPHETWEADEKYLARYEHVYWQQWGQEALAVDTHHQGMDYIMLKALESDLTGVYPYPATLEDLALWTSVTPWSKISITERRTVEVP